MLAMRQHSTACTPSGLVSCWSFILFPLVFEEAELLLQSDTEQDDGTENTDVLPRMKACVTENAVDLAMMGNTDVGSHWAAETRFSDELTWRDRLGDRTPLGE